MGEPFFKIRDCCRSGGVRVFSSNYALYGDMSRRLNKVYRDFSPDGEVYSIDESFLDLTDVRPDLRIALARDMRAIVLQWTGIPTCVGIGPTKTLARLDTHIAKKMPELGGVCIVADQIRKRIAAHAMSVHGVRFKVTVSIGTAAASMSMSGIDALMRAADRALYQAKAQGRNCTVQWPPTLEPSQVAAE